MSFKLTASLLLLSLTQSLCWEALPSIPSGRRSQFLVLHENGGYKYGYDTGDGNAAKQSADASNQVAGHYFYKNAAGQDFDLKYTSGVQGFVPEGLEKIQADLSRSAPLPHLVPSVPVVSHYSASSESSDDQAGTGDASYAFSFDTDSYKRHESADARGNVQGSYSYSNGAGVHDLSYIAGENTGFVATSGSLSRANGLKEGQYAQSYQATVAPLSYQAPSSGYSYSAPASVGVAAPVHTNADGSYSYGFNTGDSSQQQSSDASGNVQGSYSYKNTAGSHDLSYVAGSQTGFLVTGGSLAEPNGLGKSSPSTYNTYAPAVAVKSSLGYPAATTFLPTHPAPVSTYSAEGDDQSNTGDASYNFSIDTDEYKRHEVSDASGNVQGSYSYKNAAGNHDLSYVAGSQTGFVATGGSLSNPELANKLAYSTAPVTTASNGYLPPVASAGVTVDAYSGDSQDDLSNTGDSSYSFTVDTDDYKRTESSDASGNVKGSFSYKNEAGNHDLSFVAGSATGFLPTGGSLSDPNAITAKIAALPYNQQSSTGAASVYSGYPLAKTSSTDEQSSGDASYSFAIDTDEYKRHEASDANGNIQGSYSYKNSVGNHDLSYVAGSATGFLPTGGSLSVAPGLSETQLRSGAGSSSVWAKSGAASSTAWSKSQVTLPQVHSYSVHTPVVNAILPVTKTSYSLGDNAVVHTYLPPSNDKKKFGYIYDTKY